MGNQVAIGIAAGLAAALLYGSVAAGSVLALVLFYLAVLPLFIAGLGWGWATAGVGALAGSLAIVIALGPLAGLVFLIAVAAPPVWLSSLVLLSREHADATGAVVREWYPIGRVVAWTSVLAGVLILPSIVVFGLTLEAYEASVRQMFDQLFAGGTGPNGQPLPAGVDAERFAEFFIRFIPPFSVVVWIATTLGNMYAAARAVRASGRLVRPWPNLKAFELPRGLALALAGAIIVSFMPGMIGLVAGAFTAGLMFAYTLAGLAIMHTITMPSPLRHIILGGVYFTLLFLGWSATVLSWSGLLLALLGLSEPLHNLRARMSARPAGPGGRTGPPHSNI